ncbi:MAG TPA: hypothetical protein DEG96_09340, partial [Candidatus Atribacteria bacterium]|nr:hypothetical protein [Candidatus Atribacteria bacterium]
MQEKPLQLEKSYELIIEGYSHQGEGIGKINNFTVFVPVYNFMFRYVSSNRS